VKSPKIIIETLIAAPIERCFDLSRSIDLHTDSMKHTGERAIAGRTRGLIELGETVTWEAKHFGIRQNLTSKITEFEYPNYFVDEQVSGAFKSIRHEHRFERRGNQTLMTDNFIFESPLGLLGRLANVLFLKSYMKILLLKRNEIIKQAAETLP
jgi:ligand-binding SRPBCC domain-containing protein